MDLIADLVTSRGKTVAAVLHDLNLAGRYADHIVMLEDGKVAARTTWRSDVSIIEGVYGISGIVVADPSLKRQC